MAISHHALKSESPPKDYTHFVDFPVEIVGKDGIIREYTFEQSIHLYQQRIRNARLRYREQEGMQHEVEHCTKRIAQLRRSFFARYAWEAFQCTEPIEFQLTPIFAGELAAYLRRRFGAGVLRPPIKIKGLSPIQSTDLKQPLSFQLELGYENQIFLLHVFFSTESYQWYLRTIDTAPNGQHQEYLCDMHALNDMYFVLVSDSPPPAGLLLKSNRNKSSSKNALLRRGYESLLRGYTVDALDLFITAYEDAPYTRGAYWGAAIVADQLRAYSETEFALRLGAHYFPQDAGLQLRLAASYVRRGASQSVEQLHIARRLNGDTPLVKMLQVIHNIQTGSIRSPISQLINLDNTLKHYPGVRRTQRWLVHNLCRRLINSIILLGIAFLNSLILINEYVSAGQIESQWAVFILLASLIGYLGYRTYWSIQFRRQLTAIKGRQIHLLPSSDLNEVLRSFLSTQ